MKRDEGGGRTEEVRVLHMYSRALKIQQLEYM